MVIGTPVLERPDLARMTRPPPRERVISYGVGGLWCDTICSLSVGREAAPRGSPPYSRLVTISPVRSWCPDRPGGSAPM